MKNGFLTLFQLIDEGCLRSFGLLHFFRRVLLMIFVHSSLGEGNRTLLANSKGLRSSEIMREPLISMLDKFGVPQQ